MNDSLSLLAAMVSTSGVWLLSILPQRPTTLPIMVVILNYRSHRSADVPGVVSANSASEQIRDADRPSSEME
jgi:hypothetical protein